MSSKHRQFSHEEMEVIVKVLTSDTVQNIIGAEEWDLTEEEEMLLWKIIKRMEG
jgi:hypothetical protein